MLKIFWANGINKHSFPIGWGLSGNGAVSQAEAISRPWKWIGLVLTGEKLVCDSDCALFTLPAHGSCHGCLIAWIERLQMLGDKAWSWKENQSWRAKNGFAWSQLQSYNKLTVVTCPVARHYPVWKSPLSLYLDRAGQYIDIVIMD